jgi:alpha-tubulin suppressor-like RCC1 family protein
MIYLITEEAVTLRTKYTIESHHALNLSTFIGPHTQIKKIVCGLYGSALVTMSGQVYATPMSNDHHSWSLLESMKNVKIIDIAYQYYSLIAVDEECNLYKDDRSKDTPCIVISSKQFPQLKLWKRLICAGYHTIVLTSEPLNNVFGIDCANTGTLELPRKSSSSELLVRLDDELLCNQYIVDAAAGYQQSHFVTSTGILYSCGYHNDGSLFGNNNGKLAAVTILPGPVERVWSGYRHALVKIRGDRYFVAGFNGYSQLDMINNDQKRRAKDSQDRVDPPVEIHLPFSTPLHDIYLGGFCTIFVSKQNEMYCYSQMLSGSCKFPRTVEHDTLQLHVATGGWHQILYYQPRQNTTIEKFMTTMLSQTRKRSDRCDVVIVTQ